MKRMTLLLLFMILTIRPSLFAQSITAATRVNPDGEELKLEFTASATGAIKSLGFGVAGTEGDGWSLLASKESPSSGVYALATAGGLDHTGNEIAMQINLPSQVIQPKGPGTFPVRLRMTVGEPKPALLVTQTFTGYPNRREVRWDFTVTNITPDKLPVFNLYLTKHTIPPLEAAVDVTDHSVTLTNPTVQRHDNIMFIDETPQMLEPDTGKSFPIEIPVSGNFLNTIGSALPEIFSFEPAHIFTLPLVFAGPGEYVVRFRWDMNSGIANQGGVPTPALLPGESRMVRLTYKVF